MDPIYIVGGLVAILILVLFLAYFVFFKEQTFEDAVANQKAVGDIFSSGKNASNKTGVRHRKKVKKERPKSEEESELLVGKGEELLESVAPITNISFEDEAKSLFEASPDKSTVVENSEDDKTVQKPKKKSRDKRKSDHRNEMTLPSKEQEAIIEKNEIVVEDIMVNSNVEEVLESLPPMPEELPPKEGSPGGPVALSKKSKKSKGSKEKQVNADSSNLNDILEKLDTASLNHSEIQKLVDVLLDKQKSADEWKKSGGKPNPIDLLQKQLNHKDEALKDEYLRAENLAMKVKELREENVENITKYKAAETSALQKIKTLEKENEALQLRMNASQERNALEQEKLIAALQTSKETSNKEDLASTKELLKNLESQKSEMEAQIEALEKDINSKKENEANLRQQATEANERVKNFDLVKNSLTKELKETVKSKQDSEHRLEVAKKDLDAALAEKSTYLQQANTLKSELDEEKTKKCELEKMFNALELKMKETSDNHAREKEDFMKQLESHGKKDQVQVAELQKQSEDTLKQLEEIKQKLNQSEKDHENTKKDFANQGAILTKQEAEINDLKCSNNSKDEKIELLTKTLNERKEEIIVVKNNVSQELNSAPQDDTKVKELEEQIEKLTGQLNENKTQIATWEKSIETMTAKNNELREKNWKAMDALSTAEKQRDVDIKKALSSVKEENQQTVKSLHESIKIYLCQIHPTLSVDKDLPYEKFLEIYQNELNVNESSSNDAKKQSEDTLKQLEEIKQKLNQSEKDHENTKKDFANQGEILTKQEAEINDLKCSNNSKDEKIELLTKTLNDRKEEIIVVKNDVSQELNSAPQDDTKVKELEEQIEKLTGQLNEKKTQIATWEQSIESMKTKNNELREKNWKAMDALSTAEKQRDVDIKKALSSVKEENQQTVKSLHESIKIYLCQIHPTLSVDKDLPYEKFLEIYQNELNVNESSSNDAKVKKLEEHLEMLTKEKDRTDVEYNQCKETIKIKESKLNEALKQKEDIDNQFNKYKTLLSATETMLRDLEANVEKEIAELKVSKNTELEKKNSLIDDLKKKYEKACDESKSKDGDIASLKTALAKKDESVDKDLEKEKLLSTLEELKRSLKKAEEDVKSKEVKIGALENDATSKDSDIKKVNASLAQLKENITNVNNECKLKDSEAKSLRLELSTLKVAVATASNESTKERKRFLDEIEGLKAERKSLLEKVEVKEREMKEIKEENKSSELAKYKTEASDAAKVNAALRKELEEVRLQKSGSETPKKKHDKEMEAKVKSLEDKLAHSVKRESELQAQIAHMEDSTSIDDDVASDSKEKKKKSGLKGLLGSKSKYESKFRDLNEKYEHLKAESDAKTSKIAELETELQAQEKKNNELTTQVALSNGGVQNTGKALSESQVKQMAEAMTEADQTGSV